MVAALVETPTLVLLPTPTAVPLLVPAAPPALAPLLDPHWWARQTFGPVALGDRRRTRRAVTTAAALATQPTASLPRQLRDPAALKATYRLLQEPDVTCAALVAPHLAQTRRAAATPPVVLLVQDLTELDYSPHRRTTGLGPIGDGRGRGILLQFDLAIVPTSRQVLGLAALEPFLRQAAPRPNETCTERQARPRESDVWARTVIAVGPPPPTSRWVHVADRGADVFTFLAACQTQRADFLVRVTQDRVVTAATGESAHLLVLARGLPSQDTRTVAVAAQPARRGHPARPARTARVAIAWAPLAVRPPTHTPQQAPIGARVVRAWEPTPPPDEPEPLEWVLLTSVPTPALADAWERIDWYRCRWLVEDFHQCLKTGCRMEASQLRDEAPLERLLGFLAPLAVRLLQLREAVRETPAAPAVDLVGGETVALVAVRTGHPAAGMTAATFWRLVARLGGHQGRERDGPPGWRTLWHGWLYVQTLLEGIHGASPSPAKMWVKNRVETRGLEAPRTWWMCQLAACVFSFVLPFLDAVDAIDRLVARSLDSFVLRGLLADIRFGLRGLLVCARFGLHRGVRGCQQEPIHGRGIDPCVTDRDRRGRLSAECRDAGRWCRERRYGTRDERHRHRQGAEQFHSWTHQASPFLISGEPISPVWFHCRWPVWSLDGFNLISGMESHGGWVGLSTGSRDACRKP
jgi:hypothetical protein